MHVGRRPQAVPHGEPKPPSGLIQAAPFPLWSVRSIQPHWPEGVKFWLACTPTQWTPAGSATDALSWMTKSSAPGAKSIVWFRRSATSVPGRLDAPLLE